MAVGALLSRVASLERPAGSGVIESFRRATIGPADQREVLARVVRVALGTALLPHAAMEPARTLDEPGNLFMAV